jgi:iron(III) transport system ATP-binding protein
VRIVVRDLQKVFRPERGQEVRAVDNVSLDVDDGEFLVILGPSGSGKTTLLRCIAGLERADSGEIAVDGKLVYSSVRNVWVPPEQRGISMVFQSYALWPHMTVFDNVAYPLRTRRVPSAEVGQRVQQALDLVSCGGLAPRHPSQLSGGQQQRVAVARAIVNGSPVVLFDEPLSSVDARVREELRRELATLQRELGFSSVYITHDQMEASVLGHRVAVLAEGKIAQIASPRELYAKPQSRQVAEFMGAANQFAGVVCDVGPKGTRIETEFGDVAAVDLDDDRWRTGDAVTMIFRPEATRVYRAAPGDSSNVWPCEIEEQLFLGYCTEYVLRVGPATMLARTMDSCILSPGTRAWVGVDATTVRLVTAQ